MAKMRTSPAEEIDMLGQQRFEPAIGDLKENQGLRAFLIRGLEGPKIALNLACEARHPKKNGVFSKEKGMRSGKASF
ncbi:MAG: hypothetical protein ACHQYP_04810 [Nitrospiria bacterium]